MSKKEEFRALIQGKFREASQRNARHIRLNSGELHRELGGYPGPKHSMPSCCEALYEVKKSGDMIVSAPAKGKGASLTIEFKIPR